MSSLEEQLKAVRLKTVTAPKRDYSDPKLAGFTSQQEVFNYQKAVLQCNIENWYEIIKNCTFKTAFCEILNSEAKIFVQIYKRIFANKDASELSLIDWNYKLTDEEKITIKSLETRLENSLTEFVKNDGFAFVKTSSRSAKDAPLASSQFKALYSQYTAEKQQEEDTIENFQITCLLKAAFECLRIKNAEQVIEMFIKSERIYQDMLLALDHPEKFNENFVIREFVDIDVDMEFRGFVFNGKLNALSQYNFLIYSKRLNENKNEILKLISDFYYTEVSPLLLKSGFISNYVIDFAVFSSNYKKKKNIDKYN